MSDREFIMRETAPLAARAWALADATAALRRDIATQYAFTHANAEIHACNVAKEELTQVAEMLDDAFMADRPRYELTAAGRAALVEG